MVRTRPAVKLEMLWLPKKMHVARKLLKALLVMSAIKIITYVSGNTIPILRQFQ